MTVEMQMKSYHTGQLRKVWAAGRLFDKNKKMAECDQLIDQLLDLRGLDLFETYPDAGNHPLLAPFYRPTNITCDERLVLQIV